MVADTTVLDCDTFTACPQTWSFAEKLVMEDGEGGVEVRTWRGQFLRLIFFPRDQLVRQYFSNTSGNRLLMWFVWRFLGSPLCCCTGAAEHTIR